MTMATLHRVFRATSARLMGNDLNRQERQAHLVAAESYYSREEYGKAADEYLKALSNSTNAINSDIHYRLAHTYFAINDDAKAKAHLDLALPYSPANSGYLLLMAQIMQSLGETVEAGQVLDRVLARDPSRDGFYVLQEMLLRQGRITELNERADEFVRRYPDLGANLQEMSPYPLTARRKGLPPILLSTLPKSGSVFIASQLSTALRMPLVRLRPLGSEASGPAASWLESFANGGVLAQEHLPSSEHHLEVMRRLGVDRCVVHVRDPRSTAISMLHHLDKLNKQRSVGQIVAQRKVGVAFFSKPFADKLAQVMETIFLEHLRWLEDWVEYARRPGGVLVLFTNYESLHHDPQVLFGDILRFYGIPPDTADFSVEHEKSRAHHRKGNLEEWREVLSPAQQTAAWEKMRAVAERFGWKR
jgi:tetratricopeptide (TPR) repeat protein